MIEPIRNNQIFEDSNDSSSELEFEDSSDEPTEQFFETVSAITNICNYRTINKLIIMEEFNNILSIELKEKYFSICETSEKKFNIINSLLHSPGKCYKINMNDNNNCIFKHRDKSFQILPVLTNCNQDNSLLLNGPNHLSDISPLKLQKILDKYSYIPQYVKVNVQPDNLNFKAACYFSCITTTVINNLISGKGFFPIELNPHIKTWCIILKGLNDEAKNFLEENEI